MADERGKDEPTPEGDAAPENDASPEATASPKTPDLRISSHQDLGVSVSRDLSAGGWLARGDRSNMSRLKFSVQAKPRDEPDPELQALRDPPRPQGVPVSEATRAPDPAAPPSETMSGASSAPPNDAEKPAGLLGRLGRLFGGA